MTDIESLMREYFAVKDSQRALRKKRNAFMESYECKNMRQDDAWEPPKNCVLRAYGEEKLEDDACENCRKRHAYHMVLRDSGGRRTQIMRRVRHLTKKEV